MNKRLIALALAMTFGLALGANIASAEGGQSAAVFAAAETTEKGESAGTTETEAPEPDAEGTLSFENLEKRIRENNYRLRAMDLRIENVDKTNLDAARRELVDGLNYIADRQWAALSAPATGDPAFDTLSGSVGALANQSLQNGYDELRKQLDDIKSGKTARDLASMRRQLSSGEGRLIMSMESTYIQLKGHETQSEALTRAIAQLDRSTRAAEISVRNGLVSQLTLEQLKTQRAQIVSKQKSLDMAIETMRMNLQAAVGEEIGAPLNFAALPKVTEEQLAAMDLESDLERAKQVSVALLDAKATLENARQTYKDSGKAGSDQRTLKAEEYLYEASVQEFELNFRLLCAQVKDCAQQLDAAKSALALEEKNYTVSALKCKQGTISQNALADAADALANAKDTLASAERDLLSSYRNYYWAVERGILN